MQHQVLPLSLRMAGKVLSAMSRPFPGATARIFYRLYCTPPAGKLRPTHMELRNQAVMQSLQVSSYPFDNTPLKVNIYRWGNTGPKILLLHGWGGSPLHFKQLITALLQQGYQVVSYDAPAHGLSGGKRTNLVQWMHVLEQVMQEEAPFYAVIGHSFGALNAALTLSRKNVAVPRLVLLSTALSAPVFFNEALRLFRIHPVVMPKLQQLIRTRLREDLSDMDMHRYINGIKAEKIWLGYDTTDTLALATEIDDYLQQYPTIQSLRITGEGHFRIMRDTKVLNGIMTFLSAP
ncbi:alpha/beta hydrolase [Chitinophaga sp. Ak27]|uniref:alpha/beta hydrolase n=1 Tax=Chitinophaga sp. Ak27 TaxID=2726116 RepID=UPI00145EB5B3|nr:alpha/beta hydrolase [Chitinophaga sp. Ak27]NLU91653.1 alpha/beta hydrolase [Chitinophaga sp. Ak27]